MRKFNRFIFSFLLLTSIPSVIAYAAENKFIKITGDHYVVTRSNHHATSELSIQNISNDIIQQINITTNANDVVVKNSCQTGLLPHQTCKVSYIYTAGKDNTKDRNSVSSKSESLQISYRVQDNNYQQQIPFVTTHVETLRLLSLPISLSDYHELPGGRVNHIFNDVTNHTLYLSTENGLAISDDNGVHWQTLTPYGSTLNDNYDNINIGKLQPQYSYVDEDKLYVGMYDQVRKKTILMVSNDHGAAWKNLRKMSYASDMIAKGENIYIAGNGLPISHDGGKTWKNKFSENISINTIASDVNGLYVGTDSDLLLSKDNGESFVSLLANSSLCNSACNIRKIRLTKDKVYVLISDMNSGKLVAGDDKGFKTLITFSESISSADLDVMDNIIIVSNMTSLQISEDAGNTFSYSSLTPQFDRRVLVFSSNGKLDVLLIENENVSISQDLGKSWKKLPANIMFSGVKRIIANKNGANLLAAVEKKRNGLFDKITVLSMSQDGGKTWNEIDYDANIQQNIFTYKDQLYYYLKGDNSHLLHYDDKTNNWISSEVSFIPWEKPVSDANGHLYVMDSKSEYQKQWLMRSVDAATSWHNYAPVLNLQHYAGNTFFEVGEKFETYALNESVSYSDVSNLYIHKNNDNVWKKSTLPDAHIAGMKVDNENIYILSTEPCEGSCEPASMYISHDLGETWMQHEIALPHFYTRSYKLLAVKNGHIYLDKADNNFSDHHSLLVSNDEGVTWKNLGSFFGLEYYGLSNRIHDLFIADDQIYIAAVDGLYSIGVD